jgi:hypothetical protein
MFSFLGLFKAYDYAAERLAQEVDLDLDFLSFNNKRNTLDDYEDFVTDYQKRAEGVCAKVKIRIEQEAALTR